MEGGGEEEREFQFAFDALYFPSRCIPVSCQLHGIRDGLWSSTISNWQRDDAYSDARRCLERISTEEREKCIVVVVVVDEKAVGAVIAARWGRCNSAYVCTHRENAARCAMYELSFPRDGKVR